MKFHNSLLFTDKNYIFHWINTVAKKTQGIFGEKTQNTSKILKKLWPNSKKKLENRQLELSWFGGKEFKKSPDNSYISPISVVDTM